MTKKANVHKPRKPYIFKSTSSKQNKHLIMLHLQKIVNITLLASVFFSPAAMAQQLLGTPQTGNVEQHVPCFDNQGKPIRCPWLNPKPRTLGTLTETSTAKKPTGKVILGTPTCTDANGKPIKCY
jgi:hypothetical protein